MAEENKKLTVAELRNLSDNELVRRTDHHLSGLPLSSISDLVARIYHDELVRRDQNKFDKAMKYYTAWMTAMTFIVMIATIIMVLGIKLIP